MNQPKNGDPAGIPLRLRMHASEKGDLTIGQKLTSDGRHN